MNIRGENKDLHFYNKEGIKIYEYRTYSDGDWRDWRECTYNEKGDLSTCKYSAGDWHEYTYNKNGKVLTYKDSDGCWHESTYNKKGEKLTYKNSDGLKIDFDTP